MSKKSENVRVAVRCRPLNSGETSRGDSSIVSVVSRQSSITVDRPNTANDGDNNTGMSSSTTPPSRTFTFDYTYGADCTQQSIFEQTAQPIIDSVLEGYNGTIFCYGQTGTGKTHTMEGVVDDESLRGIMPNSFHYIFDTIAKAPSTIQFLVRASFLEIYLDDVFDLLSTDKERTRMEVKESKDRGVFVKDLIEQQVSCVPDMMRVLKTGTKQRKTGATKMNAGSSRSHSILSITVETSESVTVGAEMKTTYKVGKLHLVDLAGSERQKKTEAEGSRLDEAKSINWSLTVLGNVIKALIDKNAKHVPYRDSKLTRLLQDSLGGNTKTVMIANVGPAHTNWEETMATLRYADRAKQIQNKPNVNADAKDTMIKQFQDEIEALRKQLENGGGGLAGEVEVAQAEDEEDEAGAGHVELENGERVSRAGGKIVRTRVVDRVVQVGVSEDEVKRLQAEAEESRRALEDAHNAEAGEIARRRKEWEDKQAEAAAALDERQATIAAQKAKRLQLRQQLHAAESRLVQGQQLVEQSREQEVQLERNRAALRRNEEEKARMEAALRQREEGQLELADKYESLEKELAAKKAKWEKLVAKWKDSKDDEQSGRLRQQKEREELLTAVRELNRSIALKRTIQRQFMPAHTANQLRQRVQFDDQAGVFVLAKANEDADEAHSDSSAIRRPPSVRGVAASFSLFTADEYRKGLVHPMPVSDYTLRGISAAVLAEERRAEDGAADDGELVAAVLPLRWRYDNIVDIALDMPERSTKDYSPASMDADEYSRGRRL